MKTVAITGPRETLIQDVQRPQIKEDFVLIKIHVAPMCTEYHGFISGGPTSCLGHEAAGEVVEVAQPGRVKIGDRVAVMPLNACGKCSLCLGGRYIHCEDGGDPLQICDSETGTATYAQFLIKQDWMLLPLPDDVSYAHGSMACCGLGPTFGAMQHMKVDAYDTVLIAGLGPVGLGGVINGVYRGANVIGLEGNPYRAQLALELGASAVVNPADPDALEKIKQLTGGKGVDKAIDCTAAPAAQKFVTEATRRCGHVTFVGWGGGFETGNMVPQGLTLQGSWHWNSQDSAKMIQLIRATGPSIDKLVTHTFPMDQVQQAFELQTTGQCGKVLLQPWA